MRQENIRNIAIIAHVDHGKTTLVDQMLRATDAFRENQQVQERVLDSNDQERERGITILAKNISIEYQGVKINVIDTPGHADFGGEVERVLRMADGALLLVDAAEGPMPQTRFVLRHAIDAGLAIMIVVNKIDREGARPEAVVNDSLDLMADLGATDEQLEFAMEHVIYASAVNGFARLDPADDNQDMFPMLDMIVSDLPAPEVDVDGPLAMQCVTIDHSEYVGRIGIGRIYSGTIHAGDKILVVKNDGERAIATVKQLFTFDYLGRTECTEVGAGDIAAVVGVSPYRTALQVYLDKVGESEPNEAGQAAYWGKQIEDLVAQEFQTRTGMKVQRVNSILRAGADGWQIANIDRAVVNPDISGRVCVQSAAKQAETGRMLSTDAILECKTASSYMADLWGDSQETEIKAGEVTSDHEIPIYYETQVQWYLGVTGAKICYVAALLGGQDFRIYRVNRDDEVIAALQEQCRTFWFEHVQKQVPPEPHTAEEVQKLFAKDTGEMIEATNEVATDIGELRNLVEQVKALEAEQKIVKDRICAALGERTGFLIAGEKACTFKAQKSTRFDTTRFKKEQPETYASYIKSSEIRVFRLTA